MLAAVALALQAAPLAATPPLPADLAELPPLRWRVPPLYDREMARFVMDEAKAGRCAAALPTPTGYALQVDVALLVGPHGNARAIRPKAIGCSTVEQYTTGLISRAARENVEGDPAGPAWYRASITFRWPS